MMSNLTTIHERTASLPKQGDASADSPVVSGVKVLGIESKNGRKYPIEVMRKALEKYEGAIVNIDHPAGSEPRSYEDRFGRLTNARMEADGIYADLAYNPKHPLAEGFQWWVKNDPKAIGLSHNAQAKTKMNQEGVEEIEEIVKVDSVDLVAEPATTAGLMECVMRAKETKQPSIKFRSEAREFKKGNRMNVKEGDAEKLGFEKSWMKLIDDSDDLLYKVLDTLKNALRSHTYRKYVHNNFYTDLKNCISKVDSAHRELDLFIGKGLDGTYSVEPKEESKPRKKLNVTEAKKRKAYKRMLVSEAIKEILTIRKGV